MKHFALISFIVLILTFCPLNILANNKYQYSIGIKASSVEINKDSNQGVIFNGSITKQSDSYLILTNDNINSNDIKEIVSNNCDEIQCYPLAYENKVNDLIIKTSKNHIPRVTAKMYINASKETGTPVELLLMIGRMESNQCSNTARNNCFSVKCSDGKYCIYKTPEEGVLAGAKWFQRWSKKLDVLNTADGFLYTKMLRTYRGTNASSKEYTGWLQEIRNYLMN